MATAKEEEEFTAEEVEVAAILCNLKKNLRARERRWRRRMQRLMPAPLEIPSWGRRRPRSMPAPAPPASGVAERDGAASPDTPLAYPESGGDDAPAEEEDAKKPASHEEWVHEQQGVVASLSRENAHLLKQIEEYRARLESSRSTNESLKQLHKVKREQQQQEELEQARKRPRVEAPPHARTPRLPPPRIRPAASRLQPDKIRSPPMATAKEEEEFTAEEVEVAAILCNLKKNLRARERRWRRRMQRLMPAPPEIPSWGRRRPRSMPAPAPPASGVAERDGAASPDTPLAYPESGGDDAPAEEEDAKKPASHEQWVHEQQGVVASLSRENAHLLKQIEEYRARLESSRSTNESLKQLHKVKREQQQQEELEQARKRPRVEAPAAAAAAAVGLGLDLNEPARTPEEDAQARVRQAQAAAAAAAAEWYRRAQLQAAMRKAAVSAGARRRRLEILRAKVVCPLASSRPRRVG